MKKIILVLASILLTIGITVYATNSIFTDQNSFSNWYKGAVLKLNDLRVIKGYPDGSFRPQNQVNRAELAVMLNRMNDVVETKVFLSLVGLKRAEGDKNAEIKAAIAMAEADMNILDKAPNAEDWGLHKFTSAELSEMSLTIPQGYALYRNTSSMLAYFLHFQGNRQGVATSEYGVDRWYGPFWYPYAENPESFIYNVIF